MKSRSIPQKLRPPKRPFCLGVMANEFRGLYRTLTEAYVTNGMMAFYVPEANYRVFGYEPDFDSLPWKENYDAAQASLTPLVRNRPVPRPALS